MTAQSETESWTIRRLLTWTQQRFTAQRLGSPRLDAELLLGHSLGRQRIELYTNYEKALEPAELERYRGFIKRRLQGEPVAYLIGHKEFYSLDLQVTEAVLIPRPETELLVDQALALLPLREGRAKAPTATAVAPDPEVEIDVAEHQVPAERGVALTVHYEAVVPAEAPEDADEDPDADEDADADAPVAAQASVPITVSREDDAATASGARPEGAATAPGLRPEGAATALGSRLKSAATALGSRLESAATASGLRPEGVAAGPGSRPDGAAPIKAVPGAAPSPSGPPTAVIADVGTGSGAVALAIKHERPDVRVLAIDRSDDALQVAAKNAERLGLGIEFLHGDLLAPLPPALRLDLITANLPYIPSATIATLSAEVRAEPPEALDGGPDGLTLVRRLIDTAPLHLRRGGALLLEIGMGQHEAVEALLRAAGFVDVQSHLDLAQIPRVVVGHLR